MSTYNGTVVNDLDATTPLEGCVPSEINNAIREVKSCLKTTLGVDHLQTTGKHKWALSSKTGAYSAVVGDDILLVSNTTTITLYAASGNSGKALTIVNNGTNIVTIDGNASETIDGANTLTLQPKEGVTLFCDGSNWVTNRKKPAFRGCRVQLPSDITIAETTTTTINFSTANGATEDYDTDTIHDLVTNPSRLTVPTGVTKVRIEALFKWGVLCTGDGYGSVTLSLYKNGSSLHADDATLDIYNGSPLTQGFSTGVISVIAGDYFELKGHFNMQAVTALTSHGAGSFFAMEIVE